MKNNSRDFIIIKGARVHNLKDVSLKIPKNKLIVITGLSGSGKSSLAFDTIYAEAERRFIESLSSYARQFLGVSDKPDVDSIEGLSPAIAIDQKNTSKNPRSTVGTITEIYDYLRILFSRIGKPHCPNCKKPVAHQTAEQIVKQVQAIPNKTEVLILAPLIRDKKGEHAHILKEVRIAGFVRVRIDGDLYRMEDAIVQKLDKNKKHSVDVVVDRFSKNTDIDRARIFDSVETALKVGKGFMTLVKDGTDTIVSEHFACMTCDISIPSIEPRIFSFNSPYGACFHCTGLGSTLEIDENLVLPNKNLTLAEGAIRPWTSTANRAGRQSWYYWLLSDLAQRYKFSLNDPVKNLPKKIIEILLYGEKGDTPTDETNTSENSAQSEIRPLTKTEEHSPFEGIAKNLKRRWKETDSEWSRAEIEKYMIVSVCPVCNGKRLKQESLAVLIDGKNIADISSRSIEELELFFKKFSPSSRSSAIIASPLIKEIMKRLSFLKDVGLEYVALDRESTTLSGGEAQRIRLATQIGSRLTGVLYILDEPSIGLHPRDHHQLIETLKNLRDLGNTVIVVEHDAETMRSADWIIDMGPGAGKHGGEIVFEGTPSEAWRAKTLTGEYLSGKKTVSVASSTKGENTRSITIVGATHNNLKNVTAKIPLERFVVVTGVSGSGKSSLINDILAKELSRYFYNAHYIPGKHKKIDGLEAIDKVVIVDQSPIGRTPRSNPVTYTGAFTIIRELFAMTNEARARGFNPGRFSFNVKGGRCESCEGQGAKKIEMYFLPDVFVECEECHGKRYNQEALSIEYGGKNIHEILQMTVEEALQFFKNIPKLKDKFETLMKVGLGYVSLGQSATTLSGGEAQRIKLATELSRRDTGRTLYVLDEPTTGLHFEDIRKLLQVLKALVEKKNSVIVIEHNLDVIKNADWIIDLGPGSGEKGGAIVAEGTPEEVAKVSASYTGQWLKKS
ncbi:MAG: excinuclease ABC subunit UvrA [Patescibacteria group bacterium]